jgi:hypothetical protein
MGDILLLFLLQLDQTDWFFTFLQLDRNQELSNLARRCASSCPKGEEDTDGNYENYLEHVKATGLKILCSCEDGAELSHPISR